jgi:DNA repair protein RadC
MRERFRSEGLDNFSDVQVLELLLFYCVPRKDTNPIAHALLQSFGSLAQVMDAPVEELAKIPGMGENAATFLSLVTAAGRYYQKDKTQNVKVLTNIDACGRHLVPCFYGKRNETVYILCLDAKCKLLCCKEIGEGSVNSAAVPVRKIVEAALAVGASTVILAHNHPSGIAVPSVEDVLVTKRVYAALRMVDVVLADHIVIADEDYVSMAQSGYSFTDDND